MRSRSKAHQQARGQEAMDLRSERPGETWDARDATARRERRLEQLIDRLPKSRRSTPPRPPQLPRAGYHRGDPRRAAAARSDAGEAPRALTPAACLARSADRAGLWLSPVRGAQIHRTIKLGERPDFIGTGVRFSPTPSAALRYWNM